MKVSSKRRHKPSRRVIGYAVFGLVWCGLLFGGVIPMWKTIQEQEVSINETQASLAELSQWSVSGAWLAEANRRREPELTRQYNQLFSQNKDLSALYFELAQVARQSGIPSFDLQEVNAAGTILPASEWTDPGTDVGSTVDNLMRETGVRMTDLASTRLRSYQVRASFETDYDKLTTLLDGIRAVERALTITSMHITPDGEGISAELELEYYVQE